MYFTSPKLIYLINRSLYLLTTFIHFTYHHPTSGNHQPIFSVSMSLSIAPGAGVGGCGRFILQISETIQMAKYYKDTKFQSEMQIR